jgi:hypothetical protein
MNLDTTIKRINALGADTAGLGHTKSSNSLSRSGAKSLWKACSPRRNSFASSRFLLNGFSPTYRYLMGAKTSLQ